MYHICNKSTIYKWTSKLFGSDYLPCVLRVKKCLKPFILWVNWHDIILALFHPNYSSVVSASRIIKSHMIHTSVRRFKYFPELVLLLIVHVYAITMHV